MSAKIEIETPPNAYVVAVVGSRAIGHIVVLEIGGFFFYSDDYSGSSLTPIYIRDWVSISIAALSREEVKTTGRLRQSRKARQFRQLRNTLK